MSDSFHTIVIGVGSGGLTVAVGLANLGKPVAVIEPEGSWRCRSGEGT